MRANLEAAHYSDRDHHKSCLWDMVIDWKRHKKITWVIKIFHILIQFKYVDVDIGQDSSIYKLKICTFYFM